METNNQKTVSNSDKVRVLESNQAVFSELQLAADKAYAFFTHKLKTAKPVKEVRDDLERLQKNCLELYQLFGVALSACSDELKKYDNEE